VNAARPVPLMAVIKPAPRRHPARPRNRRAGSPARGVDEDDLKDWVKKVVDALPPLTGEQRDLLALIFRSNYRR
jgi:hypothetical protein